MESLKSADSFQAFPIQDLDKPRFPEPWKSRCTFLQELGGEVGGLPELLWDITKLQHSRTRQRQTLLLRARIYSCAGPAKSILGPEPRNPKL